MIVHRINFHFLIFCVVTVFAPNTAAAHGSVVGESDSCVIKVSYLQAHFKIYQPRTTGHEQYCEDLPAATESVFIMEYQHDSLATMPIDFRIIRNVTGKGRFARLEDIEAIGDLTAATVFFKHAEVDPDVYTVVHDFAEEGDYVGIVSARHAETGKVYSAVFPFEVGFTGWGYWPFFIGVLILIQIQYLVMSGRLRRWFGKAVPTVFLIVWVLVLPQAAVAGEFVVTWSTPNGSPQINRMHSWVLHIEDEAGNAIEGARIDVVGGMPEHDHGLPTKPRVTAELGGGDYRLDGMRFHMNGYWEIVVTIATVSATSTVIIPLRL